MSAIISLYWCRGESPYRRAVASFYTIIYHENVNILLSFQAGDDRVRQEYFRCFLEALFHLFLLRLLLTDITKRWWYGKPTTFIYLVTKYAQAWLMWMTFLDGIMRRLFSKCSHSITISQFTLLFSQIWGNIAYSNAINTKYLFKV